MYITTRVVRVVRSAILPNPRRDGYSVGVNRLLKLSHMLLQFHPQAHRRCAASTLSTPVLKFKLEDTKRNSEKLIDTLKAVLEETDIRIADLKKEAYEFKRDIVVGAENMRTGNTMAEKVSTTFVTVAGMDLQ